MSKGSIVTTIAGFGSDHTILEEHFFEMGSNTPVEVHFLATEEEATSLLNLCKEKGISLHYSQSMVEENNT